MDIGTPTFLRSANANINDIINKGQVVPPALRASIFYELYGQKLAKIDLFQGVSMACMKEICLRATNLENYFSGHVIQCKGVKVDGIVVVLNGSVLLGKHGLAISGEYVFAEHYFDKDAVADTTVYAFTFSEIVKINEIAMEQVFKHYPEDGEIFKNNVLHKSNKA